MDSIVQIAQVSTFWPGPPALLSAAAPPLLLDPGVLSATAVLAYSTRKLRSAYAGNAVKVTRSSDNATQDIGFSGSDLDNASLATFVGANSGFVNTIYDQSLTGIDALQATIPNQSIIVSAGANVTINSKTAIKAVNNSGTQNNTGYKFTLAGQAQPLTVAICLKMDDVTTNVGGGQFTDGNSGPRILLGTSAGPSYQMFAGGGSHSGGTLDTSIHSLIARYNNGSSGGLNVDGTAVITASDFGTNSMTQQSYMSEDAGGTANTLNCTYCEFLVFSSAISSADETVIRNSWQSYWGAP